MTSLESLLVGSKCATKTLTGKDAAQLWKTDIDTVVEYCVNDVRSLIALCDLLAVQKSLGRVAKVSGKVSTWVPYEAGTIRGVFACLNQYDAARPRVDFMDSPPNPKDAIEWVRQVLEPA
jgi:hypothetical protein